MLFTIVYTLVDDLYQQAVPASIRERGQRNGCPPTLSDSEVITIALLGQLLGMDSEKACMVLCAKTVGRCSHSSSNALASTAAGARASLRSDA